MGICFLHKRFQVHVGCNLRWALRWQGCWKGRIRTSRCPCRDSICTLKTSSYPCHIVPGSRSKFGIWTTVLSLYSCNIAKCDVKPQPTNQLETINLLSYSNSRNRVVSVFQPHTSFLRGISPMVWNGTSLADRGIALYI